MVSPTWEYAGQIHEAVRIGIAATEREDYEGALKLFSIVYTAGNEVPVNGLSYYGLCLAKAERKFNAGVQLCEKAIDSQFYDSAHYINLIKLFLSAKSRRKAVEVLETAIARMPTDPRVQAMRAEMGYRARPVIRFLHRDNPVNVILGKRRKRKLMRKLRPRPERSAVKTMAWVTPAFLAWIGLLVWAMLRFM